MERQGHYGHGTTGQGQYGHGTTGRVDEYGNPVAGYGTGTGGMDMGAHGATGTGGLGMGTHGTGAGAGMGGHGQFQPTREEHKTGGILRRSGSSSSSSSSEDDGMGGRRKKGIKEKIKEKLPGGHKNDQQQMGTGNTYGQQGHTGMTGTTGTGTGIYGHETGEKGFMDKIKEKLSGQHQGALYDDV